MSEKDEVVLIGKFLKVFSLEEYFEKGKEEVLLRKIDSWIPISSIKEIHAIEEIKKKYSVRLLESMFPNKEISRIDTKDSNYFFLSSAEDLLLTL